MYPIIAITAQLKPQQYIAQRVRFGPSCTRIEIHETNIQRNYTHSKHTILIGQQQLKHNTPSLQFTWRFGFFRYITFTIYLDVMYITKCI
jgi:hypothetical protein